MGRFTNGLLIGAGVSMLLAPLTGKEMRSFLIERYGYLRGIPPQNEELKQQVQQMNERVQDVQQKANRAAQMGTAAQNYAQQTASSVSSVQSDLGNVAQQAGTDMSQAGPGTTETTQPLQPKRPTP